MTASYLWAWDETNDVWVKLQADINGKLLISDLDPFTVQQTTPMNLRHVPHGYYAAGPSYLPYAVDSAGKLQLAIAALQHLSDIADVNLTGLADGDFIYYDNATSKWKNLAHKDATTGVHAFDKSCRVTHSVDQTIPTSTMTTLAFDTERFDTDIIHDTVTNNSRLTCKTAGKYIAGFNIRFAGNATGYREVDIVHSVDNVVGRSVVSIVSGTPPTSFAVTLVDMEVNEYLILWVYQNSGGDLAVTTTLGSGQDYSPIFWMARVA